MTVQRASILQEESVRQRLAGSGVDSVPFVLDVALDVRGPLDVAAFDRAVREVQVRHEALRSHFDLGDDGVGIVVGDPVDVQHVTLPDVEAVRARVRRELACGFDLLTGPLFRALLLEVDPVAEPRGRHVVLLVLDHLVGDGWSLQVLVRDLVGLYAQAIGHDEPELPDTAAFSAWAAQQRRDATGAEAREMTQFWTDVLPADPMALEVDVPGWHPADPQQPPPRYAGRYECTVGADHARALRSMCAEAGTSPYVVFAALLALAVTDERPRETLPVRSNTANRLRDGSADMIGYLTHEFVLPVPLGGRTSFADLLDSTAEVVFECLAHDHLPFTWTSRAAWGERSQDADRSRQLYLMVGRPWLGPVELPGCEVVVLDDEPEEPHRPGLELWVTPADDRIEVLALFSAPHYTSDAVHEIVSRVVGLLVAGEDALDARVAMSHAGSAGAAR